MTSSIVVDHVILALAWVLYFALHSALSAATIKRWVAQNMPRIYARYRLLFNVLAVVLIIPPVVMMHQLDGPALWEWRGASGVIADTLALVAIGLFLWSLRYYSGTEFLGLRASSTEQAQLVLSPMHAVVRHPWYSLALVIVWTRDMNSVFLMCATLFTLYFWIGSELEERKLCDQFGDAYRNYRKRVPRLVPWPGKRLSTQERLELEQRAAAHAGAHGGHHATPTTGARRAQ